MNNYFLTCSAIALKTTPKIRTPKNTYHSIELNGLTVTEYPNIAASNIIRNSPITENKMCLRLTLYLPNFMVLRRKSILNN